MIRPDIKKLDPIVIRILEKRGIDTEKKIQEFLSPVPKLTYDPFLMKNMNEAVELVARHIRSGSRICIYGDYDVDGITAVTLLTEYLGHLTDDIFYYIPSRFEEGYGLNTGALDRIKAKGADLIITVDCGCVSGNEVSYAKELGMEVLVTDHHETDDRSPECIMLDPKQDGETYPFRDLCGCGVAFKLAQALGKKLDVPKIVLNRTLDITGIATIADVVPLQDENRTLVKYGFDRIRKRQRTGLYMLADSIGIDTNDLSSYNISFGIAPHLNSAGRLSTADIAVELLSSEETAGAIELSSKLIELNRKRRSLQEELYDRAVEYADSLQPETALIFFNAEEAHEGVAGIVAGKLREQYNKPVIIVSKAERPGYYKGTGRSCGRLNIFELINEYPELFEKHGGHAAACGFTIEDEKKEILRKGLEDSLQRLLAEDPGLLRDELAADIEISADDVTMELASQLSLLEPYGEGNEKPVFLVKDIVVEYTRSMGQNGKYRKYSCIGEPGNRFDVVVFDDNIPEMNDVRAGDMITVMGSVNINTWKNRSYVQVICRSILNIEHRS